MDKKWDYVAFRENMRDPDPDRPHQALFDLNQELSKDAFVLEDTVQKHVCQDVLKQALDNSDHDVQGAAVKCLPALVKKVKEAYVVETVKRVSERLEAKKTEHRAIATISLKYIVEFCPVEYKTAMRVLTAELLPALKNPSAEVLLDSLDVMTDVLRRFGSVLHELHAGVQAALLSALASPSHSVRKHTISSLAVLSSFTSDELFEEVICRHVITGIEKEKGEALRKHIQLCSSVSRSAGQRVGKYLDRIMPLLLENLKEEKLDQIEEDSEKNEVRENILQAFEAFVQRCPHQIVDFLPAIVAACKEGMSYDPYYDYDDEQADQEDDPQPECDDEDNYQDLLEAEGDDDDDVSWKVRKASAKCLSALIKSKSDCLPLVYAAICSEEALKADQAKETPSERQSLPERFKEREESVRLDIFKVFSDLLEVTSGATRETTSSPAGHRVSGSFSTSFRVTAENKPEARNLLLIKDFIADRIVKAAKDKNVKVKSTCFALLRTFLAVLGSELAPALPRFLKLSRETLATRDTSASLKTEVLQFVLLSIPFVASNEAKQCIVDLLPLIIASVHDQYYKLTLEALRTCCEIASVVVSAPGAEKNIGVLFDAVYGRLATAEVDQEVKDGAIYAVGSILKHGASQQLLLPKDVVEKSFQQLLVLVKGDYSRVPVIKTLTVTKEVAMSAELVNAFVEQLGTFLKKSSRPLRQATLYCLRTMIDRRSAAIDPKLVEGIMAEVTPLICDNDLHLCHLAVDLCTTTVTSFPSVIPAVEQKTLPNLLLLLKSPLLQGSALGSVEDLFATLCPSVGMGHRPFLDSVLAAGVSAGVEQKQVLLSVAVVAARVTNTASADQQAKTVEQYLSMLSQSDTDCALALACLGELGMLVDLSGDVRILPAIRSRFKHTREEVKVLACNAVGKLTYGSVDTLLPGILRDIQDSETERYLLLRALKESLLHADPRSEYDPIGQHIESILAACTRHAGAPDEGTRNVVAECLGKLAYLRPAVVVESMKRSTDPKDDVSCSTFIMAFKYAIAEPTLRYDGLEEDVKFFLSHMTKPEGMSAEDNAKHVKVRRAAVQLFTTAVHSKPDVVRPELRAFLRKLMDQCIVDTDLVRSVNLGPITHKVDDGIELRKSSFECVDILLDGCSTSDSLLDYLNDYESVASILINGMKRPQGQEIQMLCFIMFAKLCKVPAAHAAVLASVDQLFEDMFIPNFVAKASKDCGETAKGKTMQQLESLYEFIITILKMASAVAKVPGCAENKALVNFNAVQVPRIPQAVISRNSKE